MKKQTYIGLSINVAALQVCEAGQAEHFIKTPEAAAALCEQEIAHLAQEVFVVLCLNARNQLLLKHLCTLGLLDQAPIHPREVFAPALECRARAIVLLHNHPSGKLGPSDDDLQITRRFVEIGNLLRIMVMDHVILAGYPKDTPKPNPAYLSLREQGLVNFNQE